MKTDKTPEIIDVEPEIIDVESEAREEAPEVDEQAPQAERETDPEIEEIIEDFIDIGKMWAHHGVTIGKMALKSSARTFEVTAGALEKIGRRLSPKERPPRR